MKIICIGLNYKSHIEEMRHLSMPSEPVFFIKPDTSLLRNNDPFFIPDFTSNLNYECEIAVKINRIVKAIDAKFAPRCYNEIAVGIDFTARDLQQKLKAASLPWEASKAFDKSNPLPNDFIKLDELETGVDNLDFHLDINGVTVQKGNSSDMLFSIDELIAYVSKFVTLKIGDVIMTGTPKGVGKVEIGDHLEAYLCGRKMLDFDIK
ncbi:MAG: fumarylacetoacetate hydrolase family protein [Rikenellaceae bacterium]